jgi:hypothetical protein
VVSLHRTPTRRLPAGVATDQQALAAFGFDQVARVVRIGVSLR